MIEFYALIFNEEHVKAIDAQSGRQEQPSHKVDTTDPYCMWLASQHLRPLQSTSKANITAELVYCDEK